MAKAELVAKPKKNPVPFPYASEYRSDRRKSQLGDGPKKTHRCSQKLASQEAYLRTACTFRREQGERIANRMRVCGPATVSIPSLLGAFPKIINRDTTQSGRQLY